MKFAIGCLSVLAALALCVIVFVIVFSASINVPFIALVAAVAGLLLTYVFWVWQPSIPRRIIAGLVAVFAVGSGLAYIGHYDGSVAAKMRSDAEAAKAKADAETAEKERIAREKVAALAAARIEEQKREEAELQALRKTNVDQYLIKLKEREGVTKWLEEMKVLRPRQYAAHIEQEKKEAAQRIADIEDQAQRSRPLDYVKLDTSWKKGGFESVMIATFTFKSTLKYPVRDIVVRCILYANSGTELLRIDKVIYEIVPPRSTKRVTDINMGFIPSQATGASCEPRAVSG